MTISNANDIITTHFKISTNNLSKEQAENHIHELISEYKKEIVWDDTTGKIIINSNKYNKQYWLPVNEPYNAEIMTLEMNKFILL